MLPRIANLLFSSSLIFWLAVVLAQDLVGPHSLPPLATTWPPPPQWFAGGRIFEESERSREDSPRGRVLISSARFIPCAAPRTGAFVLAALVASGAAFAYLRRLVQRCFSAAGLFLPIPPPSTVNSRGCRGHSATSSASFRIPRPGPGSCFIWVGFCSRFDVSRPARASHLLLFFGRFALWDLIYVLVILDIGVFTWCHRDLGRRLT